MKGYRATIKERTPRGISVDTIWDTELTDDEWASIFVAILQDIDEYKVMRKAFARAVKINEAMKADGVSARKEA